MMKTPPCCSRFVMGGWVLLSLLAGGSTAWVIPAALTNTANTASPRQHAATSSALFATTTTRRDVLSGITAAAVGGVLQPRNAHAAATATTLEKPKTITKSMCDPSVSTWQNSRGTRIVYLLGTAHISSESAALAGNLVRDVRPEGVFVELDAKRVSRAGFESQGSNVLAGTNGQVIAVPPPSSYDMAATTTTTAATITSTPKRTNPFDFQQKALQAGSAAVGGAIKGMYNKLDSAGFQAGAEFAVAVREGQLLGSKIILGDRDVEETLQRLTKALSQTDLKALLSPNSELEQSMKQLVPNAQKEKMLMGGMGPDKKQLENAEFRQEFSSMVETMKAKENVKLLMSELKKLAPELYQAMVAERDLYMANGLDTLNQFPQIVAVMGIAHLDGVEENLRQRGWQPVMQKCPKRWT